jgi:pimeloyl-ACP methyl ester carboxylesterase
MKRTLNLLLLVISFVIGLTLSPFPAHAGPLDGCEEGVQESGALYAICMPAEGKWNGDLVVFGHGYVSPFEELAIPEDQLVLPDGTTVPGLVTSLGFAFAVTSYSKNGLAVKEGVSDVVDLVGIFRDSHPSPRHVFLVGASEGGIITALAAERHPDVFSGAMALCGPVGDFCKQINYWGDFKVIFDYFFPNVLPGSPAGVPEYVIENWADYQAAVINALTSNPHAKEQLLRVTKAPIDPSDPNSVLETALGILWYNVFATNDGIAVLKGKPFDNTRRIYTGSDNDLRLNLLVKRYKADQAALNEMAAYYQTSGRLRIPLVTMHTTGDPIVPYWHEPIYRLKALLNGSSLLHTNIPVFRYGHCEFKAEELLAGFALMVLKTTGLDLLRP